MSTALGLNIADVDVLELAVLGGVGLPDDAEHVNPDGGAIALGHPLRRPGHRRAAGGAVTEPEGPGGPQTGENTCPACAGTGQVEQEQCGTCAGSGTVTEVVGDA